MITHCPACNTHFRVHAEQLAARAGRVRCGKCGRVFNALEHLVEETAAAPEERTQAATEAMQSDGSGRAETQKAAAPQQAVTQGLPAGSGVVAAQADATESVRIPAEGSGTAEGEPRGPEAAPASPDAPRGAEIAAFGFGPAAQPQPAKPARRWLWMSGALLLLFTLLAQLLYQYRSAIIVLVPEAKPYAASLCALLACDLPLPRRIEQLSIEASDLQADTTNPNVMVLSATLKNRAVFSQQHPLLELTLTDSQDQPVVRRVLAPADYLGKTANVQAGFAANSEFAVKVFIESSQVKATGYRLYLFFP